MIAYGLPHSEPVTLTGRLLQWEPRWEGDTPYVTGAMRTSGSHGRLLRYRSVWNRIELLDAFGANAEIRVSGWFDDHGTLRLEPTLRVLED